MKVKLVCLVTGAKKNGSGNWYKATFLKVTHGVPAVADFWLSEEVGQAAMSAGLIHDRDVYVTLGLDEKLRPSIVEIIAAEEIEV